MNIKEFIKGLIQEDEIKEQENNSEDDCMDEYIPESVRKLKNIILSIDGVTGAGISKHTLQGIKSEDFIIPVFADYPLGCLQRTNGGLDDEILISSDFSISKDIVGLNALEFLSWWVRDLARSGHKIQLRSLALPPLQGQFGNTLTFTIDYFYIDPIQDLNKLLNKVEELAESLQDSKELYLNNSRENQ